jgi:hypothetical protein
MSKPNSQDIRFGLVPSCRLEFLLFIGTFASGVLGGKASGWTFNVAISTTGAITLFSSDF